MLSIDEHAGSSVVHINGVQLRNTPLYSDGVLCYSTIYVPGLFVPDLEI